MTESTAVFPSKEYWTALDVNIREVTGNLRGPKRRRGLAGWTTEELEFARSLVGERQNLPSLRRPFLLRWMQRNTPRTVAFLTLLVAFVSHVPARVFIEVAADAKMKDSPTTKRSLALRLFKTDPELLVTAHTRAQVGGVQTTMSFHASKAVSKVGLLTSGFQERLVEGLAAALEELPAYIHLDHPHTSAGEDEVTYGILYRGPKLWRRDWGRSHWDYPILKAVLHIYPRSRFLDLYCRKKTAAQPLARAIGEIVLGDPSGYRALADGEMPPEEESSSANGGRVRILREQLRRIEVENVPIAGAPSLLIRANDLRATLEALKAMGLSLEEHEIAREVRVSYVCDGVGNETSVHWNRKSGQTKYSPTPSPPVKLAILARIRARQFGGAPASK